MFLGNNSIRGALQPTYDGPYEVIEDGDKNFVIKIHNKEVKVSIGRLKPAFVFGLNLRKRSIHSRKPRLQT